MYPPPISVVSEGSVKVWYWRALLLDKIQFVQKSSQGLTMNLINIGLRLGLDPYQKMVVRFFRTGWFLLVSHKTYRSLFKKCTKIFRYGSERVESLFWMEIWRSGDGQQYLPHNHWHICHLWKSPSCTFCQCHPSDSPPDGLFLSFHCNRLQGYDSDNGSAGMLWKWEIKNVIVEFI